VSGPFDAEDKARKAAHAVIAPEHGRSIMSFDQNRQLLRSALQGAGVELAAFDERILHWLGNWEDATIAVIAGWVSRAAAGKPGAAEALPDRPVVNRSVSDAPRCAQCGGPAEERPDPYMDRMLWRHRRDQLPAAVADFLDGEHEAAPAGAL
jgi:hypothetical protein